MIAHLQTALAVAYRHVGDTTTTEAEAEAILEAIVQVGAEAEAEAAAIILHHRREARAHQMHLSGLFSARRAA